MMTMTLRLNVIMTFHVQKFIILRVVFWCMNVEEYFITGKPTGNSTIVMLSKPQNFKVLPGSKLKLHCIFRMSSFQPFANPIIWTKDQMNERSKINTMKVLQEPFLSTHRFDIQVSSQPPAYELNLYIKDLAIHDTGNYSCEIRGKKSVTLLSVVHSVLVTDPIRLLYITKAGFPLHPTGVKPIVLPRDIPDDASINSPNANYLPISDRRWSNDTRSTRGNGLENFVRGCKGPASPRDVIVTAWEPTSVRCVAVGGGLENTSARLSILLGSRNLTGQFQSFKTHSIVGSFGFRATVVTTELYSQSFVARIQDNGETLTCLARIDGTVNDVITEAKLRVAYAPVIHCQPSYVDVNRSHVCISCEVTSCPTVNSIYWLKEINDSTGELNIGTEPEDPMYSTSVKDPDSGSYETSLCIHSLSTFCSGKLNFFLFAENLVRTSTHRVALIYRDGNQTDNIRLSDTTAEVIDEYVAKRNNWTKIENVFSSSLSVFGKQLSLLMAISVSIYGIILY